MPKEIYIPILALLAWRVGALLYEIVSSIGATETVFTPSDRIDSVDFDEEKEILNNENRISQSFVEPELVYNQTLPPKPKSNYSRRSYSSRT